jgi:beta-glucosidase
VNRRGLDFYSRVVDAVLEAGITPFATLYHWDLPQALQDRGGWPSRDTAQAFAEYAAVCYEALGDRLHHWITLNEPWVVADLGYREGLFAPGHRSLPETLAAAHHLHLASGWAVRAFRESGRPGRIGITLNLAPIHPLTDSAEDAAAADRFDQWLNRWWLDPIFRGAYPPGILEMLETQMPEMEAGDLEVAATPLDFLGLNYYFRQMAQHAPGEFLDLKVTYGPGPKTAFGWEVYPEGYYEMIMRLAREYGVKDLFLTENGAAYTDVVSPDGRVHDPERIAYLQAHLEQVWRALQDRAPVRGYFLWSLLDNFEWASGFTIRFGIVYTDYQTLQRIPKDSARWYAGVIAENALE